MVARRCESETNVANEGFDGLGGDDDRRIAWLDSVPKWRPRYGRRNFASVVRFRSRDRMVAAASNCGFGMHDVGNPTFFRIKIFLDFSRL